MNNQTHSVKQEKDAVTSLQNQHVLLIRSYFVFLLLPSFSDFAWSVIMLENPSSHLLFMQVEGERSASEIKSTDLMSPPSK